MDETQIEFYDSDIKLSLKQNKDWNLTDEMRENGFIRFPITDQYFYLDNETPFIEVNMWVNHKNKIYICELRDNSREIFRFAVDSQTKAFKLIKELTSFAKDKCKIEFMLWQIQNKAKDDEYAFALEMENRKVCK